MGLTNEGGHVIYYHFTDYDLWLNRISKEGLIPQLIEDEDVACAMKRMGFNWCRGLWVWPHRNKSLVEDFFIHRRITRGFGKGILLKIHLKPQFLLSKIAQRVGFRPEFDHDLVFIVEDDEERVAHLDEPFDIYIKPVPPSSIQPLVEIGLEVKKCTKK
jgi:hypothetical protein